MSFAQFKFARLTTALFFIGSAIVSASNAYAASENKSEVSAKPAIDLIASELKEEFGFEAGGYRFLTAAEQEKIRKAPLAPRKLASSYDFEGRLKSSPEYMKFREKFFAIKFNPEKKGEAVQAIDDLLKELKDGYPNYRSSEMKLLASQLIPLRAWKGFVFRFRPLAEKANIIHSVLLTSVMSFAATMRFYFPTEQNEALFAYVTEPYEKAVQFKEAEDLQEWIENTLYPITQFSAQQVKDLPVGQPVVWDGKIFNKEATFEGVDRYALFGEAEKSAALAGYNQGMAWMTSFLAYKVKNLIPMTKKVGNLYGMDGFPFFGPVTGVPIEERVDVIKSYPEVFSLRDNNGAIKWLGLSLDHMREGMVYAKEAWRTIRDGGESEVNMINPIAIQGFRRGINSNIPELEKMLAGPTVLVSRVNGKKIQVNIPVLFTTPRSLQAFLPKKPFTKDSTYYRSLFLRDRRGQQWEEERVMFRDYFAGRAENWEISAYADWVMIEEVVNGKAKWVPVKKGKDIQTLQQVLSQSWGGNLVAMPLAAAML